MFFWKKKEETKVELKEGAIRRLYRFYGRVQGVGFRFNAHNLALEYGCTGWVRNEDDESVTMEIQGLAEDIDKVIQGLQKDRYIQIDTYDCSLLKVNPKETSFQSKYY